jgi:hypothetical protein
MRKLSLTNGRLTVDILPDCGGAISVLRWMDSERRSFDLLRAASENEIASRLASALSCVPLPPLATPDNSHEAIPNPADLAEWTVQDASNIRATLTLHQDAGKPDNAPASYQLLQRFELADGGLRILFTITNIGVRPMPARAGLRLRPDLRGGCVLKGAVSHIEAMQRPPMPEAPSLTAAGLAAGYRLAGQEMHVMLNHVRRDLRFEWPQDNLALVVTPLQGLDFIGIDYNPVAQEIWLTPLSHIAADPAGVTGGNPLQQGDSLSATLLLSAMQLTP